MIQEMLMFSSIWGIFSFVLYTSAVEEADLVTDIPGLLFQTNFKVSSQKFMNS